jgi:hypothetical protein
MARKTRKKHIYRKGSRKAQLKKFQRRYGPKKGKYVFGATVGKLKSGE